MHSRYKALPAAALPLPMFISRTLAQAAATLACMLSATIGHTQTPSTAAADTSATSGPSDQLAEIMITAQKVTQRIEDAPVAAQVVSSQQLTQANIADISDLNNLVPSLQLNGTINGRVPMGIRGISSVSNEATVGMSSGVAIMIDGIPVPSDSFAANNLMGIQSAEVLLGPQSTLGGRTAASGEINFTTRNPTPTLQGYANATTTSDGEYRVEGFLSGPLSDNVQASLDAWRTTTPYPIKNLTLNQYSNVDTYGGRAKVKFLLTDDLDVTLTARDSNSVGHGFNFVYLYVTPGNTFLFPGSPFTQAAVFPGLTLSHRNLDYTSPVPDAGSDYRDTDYSVIINYSLPGGYTLTSTSAYTQENQHQVQDLFAINEYFWQVLTGSTVFRNIQEQINEVIQSSEELKIVSPTDRPFSWLGGLFYSDDSVDERGLRALPPALIDDYVRPTSVSYDAYLRANWKFLPSTSLIPGLRFNHDDLSYSYFQGSPGPYRSAGSTQDNTVVGDVTLQQQLAPNSMAYLTFARGYSPAVYNTSAVMTSNSPMQPIPRETIDSYELGTKGTYFNKTLTLNADVFDTIYHDYQIQTYVNAPGVLTPPLQLASAGKAETRGLEIDADWLATPMTELNFAASYIRAKFDAYPNAACYPTEPAVTTTTYGWQPPAGQCAQYMLNGKASGSPYQNTTGDAMPNAPRFKANLSITQRIPLADHPYQWVLGANYVVRTGAQMLADQNPQAFQGGFGLLNLNAAFQSTDGKQSATLFVRNVTNHIYYTDIEDFWNGLWSTGPNGGNAVIGQPARDAQRYFGLNLSFHL